MKHWKFALDWMFLFMLIVSVVMFGVNILLPVDNRMLETIEYVDLAVLGGYYFFFFKGLTEAEKKIGYVKEHWIMLGLLLVPFVPLARLFPARHLFKIGANTAWHLLDRIGML